ncbi:MAG: glycosyltransferase 87 family protein [Gaiellaceae bacterium]
MSDLAVAGPLRASRSTGSLVRRLLAAPGGVVVALTAVYLYFLGLILVGGHDHWSLLYRNRFYVPALDPPFIDLLNVTSGWECTRRGVAVLASNPCDPTGRPANYPTIWMWPSGLGLGPRENTLLGIGLAVVFFAAALALIRRASIGLGLVYALGLVSPAVMLGVERGNADMFVFIVVAGALLLFRRRRALTRGIAHALLFLAAVLKLFPAFAFLLLFRQRLRWRLVGGGLAVLGFLVYVLATLGDIRTMQRTVSQQIWYSYGAGVGTDAVDDIVHGIGFQAGLHRHHADGVFVVLAVLAALALAGWLAWRRRSLAGRPGVGAGHDLEFDSFVAGSAIYVGSFALMHNWDYRLTFLLLTIPQLVRWSRTRLTPLPVPRLTLLFVIAVLWFGETSLWVPGHPYDELFNWFLFVSLGTALLLISGPPLVRTVAAAAHGTALRAEDPLARAASDGPARGSVEPTSDPRSLQSGG